MDSLDQLDQLTPSDRRLFACWCVRNTPLHDGRTTWDLLTNERSRNAVEVAEQHAAGKVTNDELATAEAAQEKKLRDMIARATRTN